MQVKKYENCNAADFLKDRDFLRWMIFNSDSDTQFWLAVVEECPALKPKIEEAIALYKNNIRFNDYKLTRAEISDSLFMLHKLIDNKGKRNRRRIIWSVSSVAAGIAFIFIAIHTKFNHVDHKQDIATFAQTLPDNNELYSSDTKLILSEDNTIILQETESSIEYAPDAIKADGKRILKEESSPYNQLIIPYGKRSTITFSDGTKAWVNAGSKLVYPAEFQNEKREIYIDGEIYVEVAEDKKRPFVVKTKLMDISVLGTKFNVSAYHTDSENNVVLLSGSVRIYSNKHDKKIVLLPNQIYSNTEKNYSVENVDANTYILWTQGLYQFESEKLGNIVIRLERYYGINIECDPTISERKCSGKLDLKNDLNKLLDELSRALSIEYRQNAEGDYTLKNKF